MAILSPETGVRRAFFSAPYVWAVIVMSLVGALLIFGILLLRPASDPLVVMGDVGRFIGPTTAGILALMKSQETHLSVNSRLDDMMTAKSSQARAEGVIEGANAEVLRAAATEPVVVEVQK